MVPLVVGSPKVEVVPRAEPVLPTGLASGRGTLRSNRNLSGAGRERCYLFFLLLVLRFGVAAEVAGVAEVAEVIVSPQRPCGWIVSALALVTKARTEMVEISKTESLHILISYCC